MKIKNYEVKVKVVEIHYLSIDAENKEDAMEQALSYGVNSSDAHSTDVEAISVKEIGKYDNN